MNHCHGNQLQVIRHLISLVFTSHLVQVVVKVHVPSAEVPSQQGGVRCEDRCHGNLTGARQDETRTGLPLMEVSDDFGFVPEVVRQLEERQVLD